MRPDNHDHVPAVLLRLRLDKAKLLDVYRKPLEQLVAEFWPRLLATAEHDRHLDLVSLPQEPLDMALLGAVVMRVDLRPDLDLLDDRLRLVLARLPGLESRLVLELAEVHELADRRPCRRGDFNEIKVRLLGQPESIGNRDNPDLLARWTYEPDFRYPDTVVDTRFSADVTSNVTSDPDPGLSRLRHFVLLAVKAQKPRTARMRGHHGLGEHRTSHLPVQHSHATLRSWHAIGVPASCVRPWPVSRSGWLDLLPARGPRR